MRSEDSPKNTQGEQEDPATPDPPQPEVVEEHFDDAEKLLSEAESSRGPLNERAIAVKSVREANLTPEALQKNAVAEPMALVAAFLSDSEGLKNAVFQNLQAEADYTKARAEFVFASAELKRAEARQLELNNQKREQDLEAQKRLNWLYTVAVVVGISGLFATLVHSFLGLLGYARWSFDQSAFNLVLSLLLTRLREVGEALGALLAWLSNVMVRR